MFHSGFDPHTSAFLVSVRGCGSFSYVWLTDFQSNSVWMFCISCHLGPETVQPVISDHTNNSITVSWSRPNGNVESFEVLLNSSSNITRSLPLDSSINSYEFKDLSAGKIYTATVTTKSGPFSEESDVTTTATCEYNYVLVSLVKKLFLHSRRKFDHANDFFFRSQSSRGYHHEECDYKLHFY